jgi:methylated-DNA-[protein]-cysteine S-methyltransferase
MPTSGIPTVVAATRTLDAPFGAITLFASTDALVAVTFPGQAPPKGVAADSTGQVRADAVLDLAARELADYFAGLRQTFTVPLAPLGTDFQLAVWQALRVIPFGEARSYGWQAQHIGKPKAVRAVGGANGRNPLSIIVPCHRVIGADGSLTGFGGGLDTKRWLLDHEAAVLKKG